ncbi:MAG: DUF5979 domain-containing protein, partial [Clostridia bacterium]|nr:DUF5979 domain-containing protein [Clostridia bacterium]
GDTITGTDLDFKNTYVPEIKTGSLTISKQVTGNLGDKEQLFTFTVTFDDDGTYSYTGSKSGVIRSGESVQLKDGESITITGIPEGVKYTVVESDNEGYTVYKTGDVGTIVADQTATASFTNEKSEVPYTGDNRPLTIWLCMMFISLVGGIETLVIGKRKREDYES